MAEAASAASVPAREYETIYILRPDTVKENAQRVATRVEEVVGREGGKLTAVETWGRRRLAYEVGRHTRGVYVLVKYAGRGTIVGELERNLRLLDDVIKYQTVQCQAAIDLEALSVDGETIKFEDIEPPPEDEEDDSYARTLGLEDGPERSQREAPEANVDDRNDNQNGNAESEEEEEES